jgi:hypothetical protein
MTVCELERGMLMREERLAYRIQAGELSFDFIREIAESTIPFRNVANLLENLVAINEWTTENLNLKCICEQIIRACKKAFTPGTVPATMRACYPSKKWDDVEPGRPKLGYDDALYPGQDVVFTTSDDWDDAGRGIKRYPHTYECILHPHMAKVYKNHDPYEGRKAWEKRTDMDGSPPVMRRRVRDAERAKEERRSC